MFGKGKPKIGKRTSQRRPDAAMRPAVLAVITGPPGTSRFKFLIGANATFCATGRLFRTRSDSRASVADKLSAAGWSWGYCSAVARDGWRWIVDAHREDRRYIVHSGELLNAFLELEATLRSDI